MDIKNWLNGKLQQGEMGIRDGKPEAIGKLTKRKRALAERLRDDEEGEKKFSEKRDWVESKGGRERARRKGRKMTSLDWVPSYFTLLCRVEGIYGILYSTPHWSNNIHRRIRCLSWTLTKDPISMEGPLLETENSFCKRWRLDLAYGFATPQRAINGGISRPKREGFSPFPIWETRRQY